MTSKLCWVFVGVAVLSLFGVVRGDSEQLEPVKPARKAVDAQGEPLPDGVLLRIGTTGLRHAGGISGLAFSPDGQSLASVCGDFRATEYAVRLWSLADGKLLMEGAVKNAAAVAFAPDGKTLASADHSGTIHLWNVATGQSIMNLPGQWNAGATTTKEIRFTQDGKSLSLTDSGGNVFLRDLSGGKKDKNFRVECHHWFRMGLSADGKLVTSAGEDHAVCIWEVATGKKLLQLPAHKDDVYAAVFSPDGRYLATGGRTNRVHLWELATGQVVYSLPSNDSIFAFAPGGRTLATCDAHNRGDVHLWDLATGKERRVLRHQRGASCLAFSRDGRLLGTGSGDGVIRVWEHATGRELLASPQDGGAPSAFLDKGRVLALNTPSGLVFHDLIPPGKESKTWGSREQFRLEGVHGVVSPDGMTVVSADANSRGSVVVWDVAKKVERHVLHGPEGGGSRTGFAVNADGQRVAVGDWRSVEIFSAVTGKSLRKMEGPKGSRGSALALSPDGKILVSAGSDRGKSLHFWNALTGKSIRQTAFSSGRDYGSSPPTLGFSPSGKVLAIGGRYRGLQLWDAGKGIKVVNLNASSPFAFSPDGRLLATAGEFASVQLWEVATGKPITELRGHTGRIVGLLFAPNGRMLASGGSDHTTLLWEVGVPRLFANAEKPRELEARESQNAWNDLAGPDAEVAYQALARLAADSAVSIRFVGQRLQPIRAPQAKQIEKWVRDLDDEKFEIRERVTRQLRLLGRPAETALRQAVEARPSVEVLRRLELLLAALGHDEIGLTGERLRTYRAVQLLEITGTPEARRVLERLASGANGAAETQMARSALLRLSKQPPS